MINFKFTFYHLQIQNIYLMELLKKKKKILELFDYRFCMYIDKNNKICCRKSRILIQNNCCKQHLIMRIVKC